MKGFADDNIEFDGNTRKFFKQVENNAGKGEIAHNKQFLLFPQCFQKTYTANTLKPGLIWERVKAFADGKLDIAKLMVSIYDRVKKHCLKRTKRWLPTFSPSPTMILKMFISYGF